jgi:hypothetical protein
MSVKTVAVLFVLGLAIAAVPSLAQDNDTVKTFKLLRDSDSAADELDLEAEEKISWERRIKGRDLEFSFALGFLDLNSTLLSHDQIIYKYTTEYTYWGDIELTGQSAFAPMLRLGHSVNNWLSFEGIACLSFSEYTAQITNAKSRKNETNAPVEDNFSIGEFDAEHRSLITFLGGGSLLLYPLNVAGDGNGLFNGLLHPYVSGGFGRMWYDMNSQYSAGPVSTNNLSFGAGIRLLGDEQISLRFEVLYHMNTVEFEPPEYFQILDEGTTRILLEDHIEIDGQRVDQIVETFEPNDISSLNWTIGVQATF